MKIALIGWGLETQSAYRFFGDEHEFLIVSEEPKKDFPDGDNITIQANTATRDPGLTANVTDLAYLKGIDTCDSVVVTPTAKKTLEKAFPADHPLWRKTTTNTQLFFEHCPTRNIVGVTGTKGKGTTSSLLTSILRTAGKTVHLGGNIGTAALDMLPDISSDDWIVLELSNFQLYRFPYSPHIAVHLMMLPEHIAEWHHTMEDYVAAKRNIFAHQTQADIAVYYPNDTYSTANVAASPGTHIPYAQAPGAHIDNKSLVVGSTDVMPTKDFGLRGDHNHQNICAAVTAAWHIIQDVDAVRSAVQSFTGLEHRLQLVRTFENVHYYDDSFGTTPDTAVVAMDALAQPKVMIVGGHDKGNDMSTMIDRLCADDITTVIGIGPIGNTIVDQLAAAHAPATTHSKPDYNNWTMPEIVDIAAQAAAPGSAVLLSAGTSSFGIFDDYKDRGNQFITAVEQL